MLATMKMQWIMVGFIIGLVQAQTPGPLVLPRLTEPVRLDGVIDESAWEAVQPLPMIQHRPVFGVPGSERTEIRLAYDDGYFYAAGCFYDSDPDGIRANGLTRDNMGSGDDLFTLLIDSFNDNENALVFMTNPAGMRGDCTIANDAEGQHGFPGNFTWNTFWDVEVERTEEGWFAEMRIPFSSLRFQNAGGEVVMGVIAYRTIGRKEERIVFPGIPPKWRSSTLKPSQARDVSLHGVHSSKPVYVTPYVLGGGNESYEIAEDSSDYLRLLDGPIRDLGLDIKYSLTNNLTLDLTYNTDFAQVEADDERVNLTRFSLFFPEKRLFFQERAGIFEFGTGGESRLFYSRRIGLSDEGPVPILGGVRLVGRAGSWDVGLLNMQTMKATFHPEPGDTVVVPAENYSVLRLRRNIINENSYLGTMFTSRVAESDTFNYAYGLDGVIRVFGDDYLTGTWAQTKDTELAADRELPPLTSGRLRATWERRTNQGLGYEFDGLWSGSDFDPGVGFTRREDFSRLRARVGYGVFPEGHSWIYSHTPEISTAIYWRNEDGFAEQKELALEWVLRTIRGGASRLEVKSTVESLVDTFFLADDESVFVPASTDAEPYYRFTELSLFGRTTRANSIHTRYNLDVGTYYDGTRRTVSVDPTWVVSPNLEVGGELEVDRVNFPRRDQVFRARIARLRIEAAFGPTLSTTAFIQYSSVSHAVVVNLRLRYNPREGTDLYLVYDEGLNTDRTRETPTLPIIDNRSIILKYSITFLPKFKRIR
ncbi:MAG: carbohydrate binding family 9 domain-containing protein [Fidelibacterota bacterium]|nr:MAG: carbohydrate binding family 9 domain-containing protein [Candidatus Neomarinimicrobiota bacterium]